MSFITLHIISGILALGIGLTSLTVRKFSRNHTILGELYHWIMLVVAISALIISYQYGRASVFTYLVPPSYLMALAGYLLAKFRPDNWLKWHISNQAGSFIALVTATLFQLVPKIWYSNIRFLGFSITFWLVLILPGLIGRFLIKRVQQRWQINKKSVTARHNSVLVQQ